MTSLKILVLLTCGILAACGHQERTSQENPEGTSGAVLTDLPDSIDVRARYLFYLHGQIVEDKGPRPEHPQFGVYEYEAIRDTLAARGLTVISEARPAGTDVWNYAQKVRDQVEKLLAGGVPPERITVAGHSKGGAIAILTSSLLQNDHINYVFLACCGDWMMGNPHIDLRGRILSIYDVSDNIASSCQTAFEQASRPLITQEITLDTGLGHGAFYRPMTEWVEPVVAWIKESREAGDGEQEGQ